MNLRKIGTKCMVKGCRHGGLKFDCYNVSLSSEYGGSVCMCADCIKAAAAELKAVEKRASHIASRKLAQGDTTEAEKTEQTKKGDTKGVTEDK